MIRFDDVSFSYPGKPVLSHFSFEIGPHDRICLFGPSGCGKTTIARLLLGLERPALGRITGAEGLRAAVVFQEDRLLPWKSVLENAALATGDLESARNALAQLGLSAEENSYPDALSGGMKRRLAIARAVATPADIMVLDEPFTGLDENAWRNAAEVLLAL